MFVTAKEIKHKWLTAFLITLFLFLLVNIFLFPLFNSGDDVFLMYTLAGGYGEMPSNLLHYNHIWHPLLGWVVKTLFTFFPGINWYTVVLLLFQCIGSTAIFYVLLKKFRWQMAFFFFFILFFFFEIRMLLSLTFTSTAWVLTTGGLLLLIQGSAGGRKVNNSIAPCILLLLAGLLRIHILLLQTLLFIPVFLLYNKKEYKTWTAALLTVLALVFLFNIQHQFFYKKNIPGWEKQERIRQTLFYAFNRPIKPGKRLSSIFHDSTERAFYFRQFFFDTNFLSAKRIENIGKAIVRKRIFNIGEDSGALYWFFVGSRIYILLLVVCFFAAWRQNIFSVIFFRWMIPAFFVFGIYGYLFLFLKISEAVYLGLAMLLWLYFILALPNRYQLSILYKKRLWISGVLLFMVAGWMGVQVVKKNIENRKNNHLFNCFVSEMKKNADKLFISTDDAAPFDFFYIWSCPSENKVPNLIYKDRIITYTYISNLHRFGLGDMMTSVYDNSNVYLLGSDFPELINYYLEKSNLKVTVSSPLSGYGCLEVRKVYSAGQN